MSHGPDLLYNIFEHYLFNAIVEDETSDEFLTRVVADYLERLSQKGQVPREHREVIESDLKEEVLEMLRKKTYGHFNLSDFRRAHLRAPTNNKARPRRAS